MLCPPLIIDFLDHLSLIDQSPGADGIVTYHYFWTALSLQSHPSEGGWSAMVKSVTMESVLVAYLLCPSDLANLKRIPGLALPSLYLPPSLDHWWSFCHPLTDRGRYGPVPGCISTVKLAHAGVGGLDSVVRHSRKLRACRVSIDDQSPVDKCQSSKVGERAAKGGASPTLSL